MKARNLTTAAKRTGLVFLTIIFLATALNAQSSKLENKEINKAAIENLIAGIKSENDGVKRDCIYYAAIYGIQDAVDVLKSELENEENSGTCALMALALYKLGEKTGSEALSKYILIDWNEKIRDINATFAETDDYQNNITVTDAKK
jgi:hypothetical protein